MLADNLAYSQSIKINAYWLMSHGIFAILLIIFHANTVSEASVKGLHFPSRVFFGMPCRPLSNLTHFLLTLTLPPPSWQHPFSKTNCSLPFSVLPSPCVAEGLQDSSSGGGPGSQVTMWHVCMFTASLTHSGEEACTVAIATLWSLSTSSYKHKKTWPDYEESFHSGIYCLLLDKYSCKM